MIRIMHARGEGACGNVAFLYDHQPETGEPVLAIHAYNLEGQGFVAHAKIICGSCKRSCVSWTLVPEGGFRK